MNQIEKLTIVSSSESFFHSLENSFESFSELKNTLKDKFTSFEEAVKSIQISKCDFVIIDARKQCTSPLEICIKMSATATNTPFIVINNKGHEAQAIACLKSGAQDYILITKGWEEKLAYSTIQSYESNKRKLQHKNELYKLKKSLFDLQELAAQKNRKQGLMTQEELEAVLQSEVKRAERHSFDVSCLMLDFNSLGIPPADNHFFESLSSIIRRGDHWSQINNGTLAAILPHTSKNQAKAAAGRIFEELATQFKFNKSQLKKLPVQIQTYDSKSRTKADKFIKDVISQASH